MQKKIKQKTHINTIRQTNNNKMQKKANEIKQKNKHYQTHDQTKKNENHQTNDKIYKGSATNHKHTQNNHKREQ